MIYLDSQTLQKIAQYRSNRVSWDKIAESYGMPRNSLKHKIISELGKERWEALANLNPKKPVIKPSKTKKEKTTESVSTGTVEPTKTIEEIKFFNTVSEEQVVVTVFIGSEKLTKVLDKATDLVRITQAVQDKDVEKLRQLMSLKSALISKGISFDNVSYQFKIDKISLDLEAKDLVVKVYNDSVNSGSDTAIKGLVNMVHSLNKVGKLHLLVQLYQFLVHEDIEILEDGSFIAYKYLSKSGDSYVDSYTKTIKQSVGDYVYTHEEKVNNDPSISCSWGLHIGSWHYIGYYPRTVSKVLVKPEDVVSVPFDYAGSKMRCKGYTLLEILDDKPSLEDFTPTEELNLVPKNSVYVDCTK